MAASASNAWVDLYLNALLSEGLSKEYVHGDDGPQETSEAANYFVNQILEAPHGISQTWRRAQATSADSVDPMAVRREYQAWRIWSIQMARAKEAGSALGAAPIDVPVGQIDEPMDSYAETPTGESWDIRNESWSLSNADRPTRPAVGIGNLPPVRTRPESASDSVAAPGLVADSPSTAKSVPPENPFRGRVDRLYIVLISMHGLVRGEDMELGRDADTGGQVKYVVELARTLASHPMVHRVELLTRLIRDPAVAADYGEEEERLAEGRGQYGGSFIVRLAAGDPQSYLPKEELWPHVREFADHGLEHIRRKLREMNEAGEPVSLYAIHGHYADAGEAAAKMAHSLDVPMVLTGHSLGRNKLDHLLRSGTANREAIEATYKISRRIEAEENALDAALMVITSTRQEVEQQWGLYDGYDPEMAAVLHRKGHLRKTSGRAMPLMAVIPPGLDFSTLKVELPSDPYQLFVDFEKTMTGETLHANLPGADPFGPSDLRDDDFLPARHDGGAVGGDSGSLPAAGGASSQPATPGKGPGSGGGSRGALSQLFGHGLNKNLSRVGSRGNLHKGASYASLSAVGESLSSEPDMWKSIKRFLQNPAKPVVLAMSRPDAKKNITTLVTAFGSNQTLREIANLVLIMGNRDKIDSLAKGSQGVITQVLKLIDQYDLYGSVAYPKAHRQSDISDIYLLARETRGVFVNIALQEPFGLTLIEAAVHGAPIVATKHGGPVDIIQTLKNGIIVEPTDAKATAQAILDIILNKDRWQRYSAAGVRNILAYSWPSHCLRYLEHAEQLKVSAAALERTGTRHRARHSFDELEGAVVDIRAELDMAEGPKAATLGTQSIMPGVDTFEPLDDIHVATARGTAAVAQPPGATGSVRIAGRRQLVYATLDTTFDMSLLANALRTVLKANDGSLAVGVLTVLTFNEVVAELEGAGVNPEDLDFLVCNCGAYIFYRAAADGDTGGGAAWRADEAWEAKTMHNWDKQLVMRTLTRLRVHRGGERVAPADRRSDVMRLPSDRGEQGVDMNDGNGPLHVILDFDPEENAPLASVDNATLIERVRKRTRRNAVRCNLTLQLVPDDSAPGGATRSVLHAMPLRASRGLALRHIVLRFDALRMSEVVYLCTPVSVHPKSSRDGFTMIGTLCSDTAPLVEGAQRVIVVPPSRKMRLSQSLDEADEIAKVASGRDQAAFEKLKVSLEPFSEERVHVLPDAMAIRDAMDRVLVR